MPDTQLPLAPPGHAHIASAYLRHGVAPHALQPPSATLRSLLEVGVPVVEGATTAREQALGLLKIAAEVEHALMVQYLYAAASVTRGADDEVDYRRALVRIAVQEMGHLATVENLLLLVGGPDAFHLQRDELRRASEKNPIPFMLNPLTRETLAQYVVAEMPAEVPQAMQTRMDELVALAKQSAHVELHRVGAIYATLKWLFLPPDEAEAWLPLSRLLPASFGQHLTASDIRPIDEVARFQAHPEEWADDAEDILIETCGSIGEAVHAIDLIASQGEGLSSAGDSHFQRFFDMAAAFDAGRITVRPLAVSPHLGTGHGAEGGEAITHPYTRLWGEVVAGQYGLLALSIEQALRMPRDGEAATRREAIAATAMRSMRTILGRLLPIFADLPMRPNDSAPAGPPFDLDPALLAPGSAEELLTRHMQSLDRLTTVYAAIEQSTEFAAHSAHAVLLRNLRNFDKSKRELFASPIA